ncbi:hypothetical protein N802_01805 [Knoellia sinensis KCTC 19936]|uniref:RDD family protein n=1 Tax=Knoellia sinensis KCTC 19936 TaxID=1385520 RepID=A0A0A0JG52_9MICO|nr:RDD family protein [Knoellia sinensis]KGN35032.1 hypothetical protein N802_01805 [Knoellia sinensis KCTC 19936]
MSVPSGPGWYENPDNPDELRYFDGILWTSNTTPLRTRQTQPTAAQPPAGSSPAAPPTVPTPVQSPPPAPPTGWQHGPGMGGQRPSPTASVPGQPTLAPYGLRVVAYLIDTIIVSFAALVLGGWFLWKAIEPIADRLDSAITTGNVATMGSALAEARLGYLAAFIGVQLLVMLAYNTLFLMKWGATPGKRLLGISVRRLDRPGPLDADTAIRRAGFQAVVQALGNVPYVASLGTFVLIADLVWPIADEKNQALHDKLAKTIVIKGRATP